MQAHGWRNLAEMSRATGLNYQTLRDWALGRNSGERLAFLLELAGACQISLDMLAKGYIANSTNLKQKQDAKSLTHHKQAHKIKPVEFKNAYVLEQAA